MNKRLLVLTGILSVLSVNVMGAPVNVGTDTITIGSTSSNNRFDGTTISSKQFWINDEFPDGSNERVIIKPGTLSMSNHNTSMDFDDNGLNIVDVGAVNSIVPGTDPSTVKVHATQVKPTGITISDGRPDGINLTYDAEAGIHAGDMKIENVDDGQADTDAVNVRQLRAATANVNVSNIMGNVGSQINKAGAVSAALSGLHYLDYNPNDKWSFATSLGHYKHSTAGAIGAAYQPNENSMVHAGVTVGGESMFNIGASFKVGEQDSTLKTSRFEMAKQIKDLQADNASLRADNDELRAEVNEIKAALQKLQ